MKPVADPSRKVIPISSQPFLRGARRRTNQKSDLSLAALLTVFGVVFFLGGLMVGMALASSLSQAVAK